MKTHLRVITESGNSWTSWINGTKAEAEEYYLNKKFNTGVVEDRMEKVIKVEFLSPPKELTMNLNLRQLLTTINSVVEYRNVKVNSFGDYVADNYPTILQDEDRDVRNHDFSEWEIDNSVNPDRILNCPADGVVIRKDDSEERCIYIFK